MTTTSEPKPPLTRRPQDGVVAGVCVGLATYLDVNVAIVRAVFVGLLVFNGFGLLAYLALVFLMGVDGAEGQANRKQNGSTVRDVPAGPGPTRP